MDEKEIFDYCRRFRRAMRLTILLDARRLGFHGKEWRRVTTSPKIHIMSVSKMDMKQGGG